MKKILLLLVLIFSFVFANENYNIKYKEIKEFTTEEKINKIFFEQERNKESKLEYLNELATKFKYLHENDMLLKPKDIHFDGSKLQVKTDKSLLNGIFFEGGWANRYDIIVKGEPTLQFFITPKNKKKKIYNFTLLILKDYFNEKKRLKVVELDYEVKKNVETIKGKNVLKNKFINNTWVDDKIIISESNTSLSYYNDRSLSFVTLDFQFDEKSNHTSSKLNSYHLKGNKYGLRTPIITFNYNIGKQSFVEEFMLKNKNGKVVIKLKDTNDLYKNNYSFDFINMVNAFVMKKNLNSSHNINNITYYQKTIKLFNNY